MSISAQVQQAYEKQYESYQSVWREIGAQQKALNIIELTQGLKLNKVLEVGAGDGSILQVLSRHTFAKELYAVEISSSALQQIHQRQLPQLKQAVLFDGYTLPFADQTFDLVILSHVLEHVEFERTLLRELLRVANYQIIEVPKDYRFDVDKKVNHFLAYGHINMYTPSSLRFLLKSEGYEILKQKVAIYSQKTYQYMFAGPGGSTIKRIIAQLLYLFKKAMVSFPANRVRDHFANTITVLTTKGKGGVEIF
jgi:ubiquinone/menaquinone biosynthesis C-methylase UbiE